MNKDNMNQNDKKKQKKLIVILILSLLVFALVISGGFYYAYNFTLSFNKNNVNKTQDNTIDDSKHNHVDSKAKDIKQVELNFDKEFKGETSEDKTLENDQTSNNKDNTSSDNSLQTSSNNSTNTTQTNNNSNTNTTSTPSTTDKPQEHTCHWVEYTETIPAWDEKVKVKDGYYEKVLVKEAWDEEQEYCAVMGYEEVEVQVCRGCGGIFYSITEANAHLLNASNDACASFYNDVIPVSEWKCLEYKIHTKHHDAEYKDVWHDAEYEVIHHPQETVTKTKCVYD